MVNVTSLSAERSQEENEAAVDETEKFITINYWNEVLSTANLPVTCKENIIENEKETANKKNVDK